MKKRNKKAIALGLIGSFSLFSLTSCSSQVNLMNRGPFSDPPVMKGVHQSRVAQFVSQLRPRPGNPDSHYLLGNYYQERGEHSKAVEEFQKVILIDPRNVRAHNGLGISYDSLKDYPRAVASYKKALELDPGLDYVLNNLGYSYLLQDKAEEAFPLLRKAIALNGREGKFHNNLGLAYAAKGDLDQALAEFKLAGDDSKAHFNIAQFYHRHGLYPVAQFHYSQALRLDPSFTHARTAIQAIDSLAGIFQTAEGKKQEAILEAKFSEKSPAQEDHAAPALPEPSRPEQDVIRSLFPESEPVLLSAAEDVRLVQAPADSRLKLAESKPFPSPGWRAEPSFQRFLSPGTQKPAPFLLKKTGIEISNGNGVNGMARRISRQLEGNGIPVRRITNAEHFNHRRSRIYYQNGYEEVAVQVAGQIPGLQKLEGRKKFDRPSINVKVILGRDLVSGPGLKEGGKS